MQYDKYHLSSAIRRMRATHQLPDNQFTDISGKSLLAGYWHNWKSEPVSGYQQGQPATIGLTDIPSDYNIVIVAFMKGSGIPTFHPGSLSAEEFRRQVLALKSRGQAVLLSLGGADAQIELYSRDIYPLAVEIIRLSDTYGFDGVDIDLEQTAIDFAENVTVIPAALKIVKEHYREKNQNFIISMAPEFPYLTDAGKYLPYLTSLEGYYDFIAPQFYNQGGDGLWVQEANNGEGAWLAQNNDALKADFIYYLCESLIEGTRGFTRIPADKLVPGLPANADAAATGHVTQPEAVFDAFRRLRQAHKPVRGLMSWSVNWDAGRDRHDQPYDWGFVKQYASLHLPGVPSVPVPPTSLTASAITDSSVLLTWTPSVSPDVMQYLVFRDGVLVSGVAFTSHQIVGLDAETEYTFYVMAKNTQGQQSASGTHLTIRTAPADIVSPPSSNENEWTGAQYQYVAGEVVTFQSHRYQCLQQHISDASWAPTVAVSLWKLLGSTLITLPYRSSAS